jgi:hypothetical protein
VQNGWLERFVCVFFFNNSNPVCVFCTNTFERH